MSNSLTEAWPSFWIVLAIQALWYTVLCKYFQIPAKASLKNMVLCGFYAIPLGLAFDLLIGEYSNVFNYVEFPNRSAFLLANWFFSYGLAIASVHVLPRLKPHASTKSQRLIGVILFLVAIIGLLKLPSIRLLTLHTMYLAGGLILFAGEAAMVIFGERGPIQLLTRGIYGPFLRLLAFSVLTGLIYESANHIAPLWIWNEQSPSRYIIEAQIIGLGYFVLFHACLASYFSISRLVIYGNSCFNARKY